VVEEADRVTNSVNTLREQIAQWIVLRKSKE